MTNRKPAEVFPPGDFLLEELEIRGWTQVDLAEILGRPPMVVNSIVNGKRSITPETAKGIAEAFGTSAEYWLRLEAAFQLSKINDTDDSVSRRAALYAKAPLKELFRRNWIEYSDNVDVLESRLCNFLKIETLEDDPVVFAHAARKSTPYDSSTPSSQVAWLLRAQQLASTLDVAPYTRNNFTPSIRKLQKLLHAVEEVRQVPRILSEAGIRFLVIEQTQGSKIDGACFWLDEKSPVVVVSLRLDRIDNFWYTVMHELGHVANEDGLNSNASLDIDLYSSRTEGEPQFEKDADQFAVETLVPQEALKEFIDRVGPLYSRNRVIGFAALHNLHPAIVIGQLQHRGELQYSQFRNLMQKSRNKVTQVVLTDGWKNALPAL